MATLIDHLQSGISTTCLCWTISRPDGLVLRLTEHEKPLHIDGDEFHPGAALTGSRFTQTDSLAPSSAAASGALTLEAITDADLLSGLWDGAKIAVIRVNWQDTSQYDDVWRGYFSEITRNGATFEAQLVSRKSDLERPLGRVYTRTCDALLGDARCGIDLTNPDFVNQSCDQLFATCRDRFANTRNFRGFPHLPGNDFVLAGPAASGNNGGKRT